MFQYKILNNILYLNYDLHRFKLVESSSCSLCHLYPETIDHLFIECIKAQKYYFEIQKWIEQFGIDLPALNKFNILLGVDDILVNFVILIYKYTLYKAKKNAFLVSLNSFKNELFMYEYIERRIAKSRKNILYHQNKWNKLII